MEMPNIMRICPLKCALFVALALASNPIANSAFAVAPNKSPVPGATAPVIHPGQNISKKLDLPVTWQLTRSRLAGTDNATVTETYRETWVLEIQAGGIYHLRSPRTVIPAYVSDQPLSDADKVPTVLMVSEEDFGKLLGIKQAESEVENQAGIVRPIAIQLSRQKKADTEILLSWSEEEHFVVQLDFSPVGMF